MMHTSFVVLLLVISSTINAIEGLVRRPVRVPMKTSVIIPCVDRHFFWLSGILESYANQTVVPDEVVISISEVEKLEPNQIDALERGGDWPFKLIVLRSKGVLIDGINRNKAMDNSTGDILIFSDADDLVHPQRVEIAKEIFENYDVDHMLHGYSRKRGGIEEVDLSDIKLIVPKSIQEVYGIEKAGFPVTTGSPCFLRKVGDAIKWWAKSDREHTNLAYGKFDKRVFVRHKLIIYRNQLSSHIAGNK